MKSKCFVCALVAGMALSAVAVAEPGANQAGGVVLQDVPVAAQSIAVSPKISSIKRGTYYAATGRVEIEGDSSPVVRGPATPVPIWQAVNFYGFYDGQSGAGVAPGNPAAELFDWGVLCGDPLTVTHQIQQFSFGYATGSDVPGDLTITIYWDFPACSPATTPQCIASQVQTFPVTGLPGDTTPCNGFVDGYIFDFVLTPDPMFPPDPVTNPDLTFSMPAGDFAYGYSGWTTWSSGCPTPVATGGMLVNEDLILAPGGDDTMEFYSAAPQTGFLGRGGFGPHSQIYFELYGLEECAPSDLGACCQADLSCTVVNEADCIALGGTWTAQVTCSAFFCYPAPANDDCLNAETIAGFGTFPYDNRGATTGTEGDPSCGPQGIDVWFEWTSPCTGSVTINGCLLNPADGDDLWSVYSGGCGSLLEVGCGDDSCGSGGGPSAVTFNATQGTTYLFRLGIWNADPAEAGEKLVEVIQGGDCVSGPAFCDADWCQDGEVGVPDIFCFLSDWFAVVPEAVNYGGTPGVPAIFAFLSEWFSTPQGPCP